MKKLTLILTLLSALPLTVAAQEIPGVQIVANGTAITAGGTVYTQTWSANGDAAVIHGLDHTAFTPVHAYYGMITSTSNALINLGDDNTVDLSAVATATNRVVVLQSLAGGTINAGDNFVIDSGTIVNAVWAINSQTTGAINIGANANIRLTGSQSYVVNAQGRITFGDQARLTVEGMAFYLHTATLALGNDATVTVTGSNGRVASLTNSYLSATNANFTAGEIGLLAMHDSEIRLVGGSITTTTDGGDYTNYAAIGFVGGGAGYIELTDVNINAAGLAISSRDANVTGTARNLIINGGTISGKTLLHSGTGSNYLGGTTNVIFNQVDLANAGGIGMASGDAEAVMQVTINGGSGLNGNVTGSGSGALTVNLNDSSLTGDITNLGDGPLTIILDNNSTGSGGFTGGNLITGEDSAWTFNQDSHVNNGNNSGIINIGDHEVTFDHLTNDGTINISVNSDTGEGGSITVIGTADGAGTVHIDTTGDGQLNPNDVLPGIVSGEGTEHWQWDPIDWGIDQLIKDGDHFVKNGTSPAGAVLNSSVAIQQAMWFAQQNSLLKRMGDLRYGARASRPLADKDVRVPYHSLIENIWLRSYGQQLNVGSKVAGRAYEQLIYGVDLGTDYKFTLSADSDLYLGVYAGYGRSDLDYRTPGADGEINSYYGGLYATWLHSSGFYIDATFKAARVDNDLKAPYGTTQLTANYSDVNLGGSIEIGHKFTFQDSWFVEPQFQVNYLHILAEDYTTGPMTITASDLDALQLRIGSIFGRTINLTNSGALQPYVKISGVETISSGGTLKNGYQSTRANTDGARAELGAGLIWQLDANNQLHLDYEASFGDKYDKPWGLTAGYRHQF